MTKILLLVNRYEAAIAPAVPLTRNLKIVVVPLRIIRLFLKGTNLMLFKMTVLIFLCFCRTVVDGL